MDVWDEAPQRAQTLCLTMLGSQHSAVSTEHFQLVLCDPRILMGACVRPTDQMMLVSMFSIQPLFQGLGHGALALSRRPPITHNVIG